MRALVTGANGFVGRHLTTHLRESGDQVVGVDRECDVTDATSVRAAIEGARPEVIYHLAALTHVGESWDNPVGFTRVNVLGTKNVLDAAFAVVPEATVVFVSSADVYGVVGEADLPLIETFRVAPANPYSSSKVEAERVAHEAFRARDQRIIVTRPFNHVGPGQSVQFVVPALVSRLMDALDEGRDEIPVGISRPDGTSATCATSFGPTGCSTSTASRARSTTSPRATTSASRTSRVSSSSNWPPECDSSPTRACCVRSSYR